MNLTPVRDALLAEARAEVGDLDRRDAAAAEARLTAARARATALVEEGRAVGERAAARESARARASAVRRARESVLHAQRLLLDELRSRAHEAVFELRADSVRYGRLLDALGEAARLGLGPEVELERDPPGAGGLVARAGNRSVDYTLPVLVDRAIDRLGSRIEEMWR